MKEKILSSDLLLQPNLGKILVSKLLQLQIDSIEKLRFTGTEKTFLKLKTLDPHACLNHLYAIEGAIEGIRWHGLSEGKKSELRDFFNSLKN